MSNSGDRLSQPSRHWQQASALVIVVVVATALSGCTFLQGLFGAPAPGAKVAATQPPLALASPAPAPTQQTAPTQQALAPTQPPPTATPQAGVSQEQAQATVRGWFNALTAGDYQRAEGLTTGAGTVKTRAVVAPIQQQLSGQSVELKAAIRRLDLSPDAHPPAGQAVRAQFDIEVDAVVGPAAVPVQQLHGGATFVVQQTDDGARITDIQSATGLPGQ